MKKLLLLFVLTVNCTLQANEEIDARIVADCKKIGQYASAGDRYTITYDGYYVPHYFMYYGPNMGEFSAEVAIEDNHARYVQDPKEYSDCTFDFTFKENRIHVKQTPGESWTCGFGHNVYAGGTYHRVEGK